MGEYLRVLMLVGSMTTSSSVYMAPASAAISLQSNPDDLAVVLAGVPAADFTSFTLSNPFRVVLDIAGNDGSEIPQETHFENELIRGVTAHEYDSESEKIRRVTIELAREVSYYIQADGGRVLVHFGTASARPGANAVDSVGLFAGPGPEKKPDLADPSDFDPGPRIMKYIGFQPLNQGARVFVRCDGKVKFKQLSEGLEFVLELENTKISLKNNRRPLDATYFNTAVTKVQAISLSNRVRIEIKLREVVPFQIKRMGTTLAVDFQAPTDAASRSQQE